VRNKDGIISLALGLLIVFTTHASSGFFMPWYLHLIFGWILIVYGTIRYFRQINKGYIITIVILTISIISTCLSLYSNLTEHNNSKDGSHPYRGVEAQTFTTLNGEFNGVIKRKKDKIYIQLNETKGRAFDSVNVLLDKELLTSNEIFITSTYDKDGLYLRGSTSKKFLISYRDYFQNQDTLRIGLDYNKDIFEENEKSIQIKFYDSTSYLMTEKIK
tara:strand:+ start:906 stop:1556 length:651 start_codon:yes stop_codon:yes gene_type:complete